VTQSTLAHIRELATGLILAGGRGRRAGGRDKGLLLWRDRPLVAHVAERLAPQVGNLMVCCNRNPQHYRALGLKTISDRRAGFAGPLAGIEAAASALATPFLIVVACDTPLLPTDLVPRLLAPLLTDRRCEVSYASDGNQPQYLCAALSSASLAGVGRQLDEGPGAVRDYYASLQSAVVDFSDCPGAFCNLNRGV
jgi:molybdopterin-guanine dinucleotide biosynthesis protein A